MGTVWTVAWMAVWIAAFGWFVGRWFLQWRFWVRPERNGFQPIEELLPWGILHKLPNPHSHGKTLAWDGKPPFWKPVDQRVKHRYSGTVDGLPAVMLDLSYSPPQKRNGWKQGWPTYHRSSLVIVDRSVEVPMVEVKQKMVANNFGNSLGMRDIETGDEDFDRRFSVFSQPESLARETLTSGVRAALMASEDRTSMYLADRFIMFSANGHRRQDSLLATAQQAVPALPIRLTDRSSGRTDWSEAT